jgi:hypothetical protein
VNWGLEHWGSDDKVCLLPIYLSVSLLSAVICCFSKKLRKSKKHHQKKKKKRKKPVNLCLL